MTHAPTAEPMVLVADLSFRYSVGDFVLRFPLLEVARSERVAVIGTSGSGKTTLLHLIAGITTPSAGRGRLAAEVLVVLAASVVLAGLLTVLAGRFGEAAIKSFLLT